MMRTMLKSKIHRATVTQADLHYVGSVTVDEDLLDAADLLPGEQVAIVDVTNGARLETYVIPGERGSGVIGINGAAAHLVHPGDLVILISYGLMDETEAKSSVPVVVHVDAANRVGELGGDPSAPVRVLRELEQALAERGVDRLADVVGLAHRPPVAHVPEGADPVGDDLVPTEEIA